MSYQSDIDQETWEESPTDTIDFERINFEDISISAKGKVFLGSETLKALGKGFIEKARPIIEAIAINTIGNTVSKAISAIIVSV